MNKIEEIKSRLMTAWTSRITDEELDWLLEMLEEARWTLMVYVSTYPYSDGGIKARALLAKINEEEETPNAKR